MTSPLPLPVTLITACVLALFNLILIVRVGQGRFLHKVSLGDGGHPDMLVRMRTHANFVEYVPLILILMGILELSNVNRLALAVGGVLLVLFRLLHAIGMPRRAPNLFRAAGAGGTILLMVVWAVWGLVLVATA